MSNLIWKLTINSLEAIETVFSGFENVDSNVSLFIVRLNIKDERIRFTPSTLELENIIVSVIEELVLSVSKIPRIESKIFSNLADNPLYLTTLTMGGDRIDGGKYLRQIVSKNSNIIQQQLTVYENFKPLFTQQAEKRVEDFLRGQHSLTEYENEIKLLQKMISEIDCTPNVVRMSMIYMACDDMKNVLKEKANNLIRMLVMAISDGQRDVNLRYVFMNLIW